MVGSCLFFFQAEDGIRDLVRSRGLGDVYKRQVLMSGRRLFHIVAELPASAWMAEAIERLPLDLAAVSYTHLTLPTIYSV